MSQMILLVTSLNTSAFTVYGCVSRMWWTYWLADRVSKLFLNSRPTLSPYPEDILTIWQSGHSRILPLHAKLQGYLLPDAAQVSPLPQSDSHQLHSGSCNVAEAFLAKKLLPRDQLFLRLVFWRKSFQKTGTLCCFWSLHHTVWGKFLASLTA